MLELLVLLIFLVVLFFLGPLLVKAAALILALSLSGLLFKRIFG
jgi:hypothetical protein